MKRGYVEEIKEQMKGKPDGALLDIWIKNDRKQWSNDTFEAIKEILELRGIQIPQQNIPIEIQKARDIVENKLNRLPKIPIKNAVKIERRFAAWTFMLLLWLIFGFFTFLGNADFADKYTKIINNLQVLTTNVNKEVSQTAKTLIPHSGTLRQLDIYNTLFTFVSLITWLVSFRVRRLFIQRKRRGPCILMILFGILLIIEAWGAIVSLPLQTEKTEPIFGNYFGRIVAFPLVTSIFLLDLINFFGKNARIFYLYTAIEPDCFKKHGEILEILKEKEGDR